MSTGQQHNAIDRRTFLASSAAAIPAVGVAAGAAGAPRAGTAPRPIRRQPANGPVAISSGNGLRAVDKAVQRMRAQARPVQAVVEGVAIVEADPEDMTVGYGGLPNERGVVQLDSSVMDGPLHRAGAVAAIENIKHPAAVALKVLQATDHCLIVGEGAYEFARAHGFPHEELLTDRAREAWLRWKENLNRRDDWLNRDQQIDFDRDPREAMAEELGIPWSYGTIHCSGVDANGDLGACTTTSGLSYKIPGRVGDSPIVGAGMFCDNEVGCGGATGRGESCIQSCAAFQVVQNMSRGDDPTEACLNVLKWIADHTKRHDLLNEHGRPNFGVTLYALRKDGAYGSATMNRGGSFTVCDADGAREEQCAVLFE